MLTRARACVCVLGGGGVANRVARNIQRAFPPQCPETQEIGTAAKPGNASSGKAPSPGQLLG